MRSVIPSWRFGAVVLIVVLVLAGAVVVMADTDGLGAEITGDNEQSDDPRNGSEVGTATVAAHLENRGESNRSVGFRVGRRPAGTTNPTLSFRSTFALGPGEQANESGTINLTDGSDEYRVSIGRPRTCVSDSCRGAVLIGIAGGDAEDVEGSLSIYDFVVPAGVTCEFRGWYTDMLDARLTLESNQTRSVNGHEMAVCS